MHRGAMLALVVLLFFTVRVAPSTAAEHAAIDPGSLVRAGTEAYQRGDFKESASLYEQALGKGGGSGKLHYNLGNAYFRLNRLGKAIAAYRHALVDLPNESAVWDNLSLARKRVKEPIEPLRATGVALSQGQLFALSLGLSRPRLLTLFHLNYALFWMTLVIYWWKRHQAWKRCSVIVGLAAVWLMIPLYLVGQDTVGQPVLRSPFGVERFGVVVSATANAYAGDSDTFQVVAVLHEGSELLLGEQREDWSEVLLPNGRKGWTKRSELEAIDS